MSRASLAAIATELEARATPKATGRPLSPAKRSALRAEAATLRAVTTDADVPPKYRERGLPDGPRINRLWRRVLADVGIDPAALRLHDLRAYSATKGAEAGETLPETMARLGHKTPNAAMLYQRVAEDHSPRRAVAATLDAELFGALTTVPTAGEPVPKPVAG